MPLPFIPSRHQGTGARRVKVRFGPCSVLGWGKVAVVPTHATGMFGRQLGGASLPPSTEVPRVFPCRGYNPLGWGGQLCVGEVDSPTFSFGTGPENY